MTMFLATLTLWAAYDTPLDRFEQFMLSRPVVHVGLTATKSGVSAGGVGSYMLERGVGQRYDMAWTDQSYTFLQSDEGIMAIEHTLKAYRKRPAYPILQIPPPELSPLAQEGFPLMFIVARLEEMLPETQWVIRRTEQVDGRELTVVGASADSPQERLDIEIWLDYAGRPWQQRRTVSLPGTTEKVTVRVTEYKQTPITDESTFALQIPLGYITLAAPIVADPLAIGQSAVWPKLKDSEGKQIDLAKQFEGKRVVLAFTGNDCPASDAWRSQSKQLKDVLAEHDCELVEIRYGSVAESNVSHTVLWDDDRTSWVDFRVPGTPFFVAIGTNGAVDRLYLGFDPDQSSRWTEVLTKSWSGS